MPVRTAQAVWKGSIGSGEGRMSFGSGAYEGAYSVPSRFEEAEGTNPEELIAAAHAGCFSMALSAGLTRAGSPPDEINTSAKVHIEKLEAGWRITRIELHTQAAVPGISAEDFQTQAQAAKEDCPVSQALASPEITLQAELLTG
ncbi:MAG: OsmC family protein [Anaerolineae bacterium]|nr:OsmC family protein [Anaerolineae bacterium]